MTQFDDFKVTLARSPEDVAAAQRLRYRVFVSEMGATGSSVDHNKHLEVDLFDAYSDHLLLSDMSRPTEDQIVGTYRLMTSKQAEITGFSSDPEFDHTRLKVSGRALLELSRSCVHPDYRDGVGMFLLWQSLSDFVAEKGVEILFGVASFWEQDAQNLSAALSLLHHRHLASDQIQSTCRTPAKFDLLPEDQVDRIAALKKVPALIKAYLRLGGMVGQGAYLDSAFGTVDVCMVVDMNGINARQRAVYSRPTK